MIRDRGRLKNVGVEIKSDRMKNPRNIFIEIVSDAARKTIGRLAPIARIKNEIYSVKFFQRIDDSWHFIEK